MSIFSFKYSHLEFNARLIYKLIALLAIISGISMTAYAGKIVSEQTANGTPGFGGWNLSNVEVQLNGGDQNSFNQNDGSYLFPDDSDHTYSSAVYLDILKNEEQILGRVLAKTWPVGEPSGIKIINDDAGVKDKPANCIMATSYLEGHYLDDDEPQQVTCSSPFQTHKRYKLAMLPTTVAGGPGNELPIDLVFNVEPDGGFRDYQVFQKINNWTGKRLQGFTIEVGFGIGDAFVSVSESANVSLDDLYLSTPSEIFNFNQLATFSSGLFGPEDKHTGARGFFDPNTRAGFKIKEYVEIVSDEIVAQAKTDILHSDGTLGSDYANMPTGAVDANQFGPWLPNNMLPYGIFFDDDGNPATDAALIAWYGANASGLNWMKGALDGFAKVDDSDIIEWGENLLYTMGEIDDLVNVGLNYIVTIGDVTNFPSPTFTIRIKPIIDTTDAGAPSYIDEEAGTAYTPVPNLTFPYSKGVLEIAPSPEFVINEPITVRVGDADLIEFPSVPMSVSVSVSNSEGEELFSEPSFPLVEQGDGRGVFAATLPDEFSEVSAGSVVTVSYVDVSEGVTLEKTVTATDPQPPLPVYADASITSLQVPDMLLNGQTRNLKLFIVNDKASAALASGSVIITGSDGSEFSSDFSDLRLGGKMKFSFSWTANLDDPEVAQSVQWSATLIITGDDGVDKVVDDAVGVTNIEVKKGKNSKK